MVNSTRDDDYNYMKIVDAMASINQRVNLIGIVTEASLPKHSNGTDYFCSIKLIDESRTSPGIAVTFFAETMEKLPRIESIGDIIILTRVTMKAHCSDVYATYLKKYSSFALFEGKHNSRNVVPYQASPNFRGREQDKPFVTKLRESQKIEADLNDLSPLKGMKEGEHINLLCKVLHVCEVTKDDWMLFVWDGTDTPPAYIEAKLENEMEDPLPLQLEASPLSRDTLCTFPPVGTVLRMVTDRGNKKFGINFLKPNKWVKVVQVKCEVHAGLWRAVLMPSSMVYYLPNNDLILQRERSYNERVTSKFKRMPLSCFPGPSPITDTDYADVPFVTLMNVLTHPEVTFKFNCVVRVVASFPWRVEDFCNPQGIYRVRLTLEDPTARIYAFLYAEDGVQFFGSHNTVDELMKKMNALLGITEGDDGCRKAISRNPPWVQCCLKSYYIDKADIWGSRNYRIFATTFVG